MNLLLIRHGEAVDAGPDVTDDHRWLTARGRAETAITAHHLRATPASAMLTSPLVRAVQTAEILAAHSPPNVPLSVLPALATGNVAAIVRFVEAWAAGGRLALVGHEPTLSQVVEALVKPTRWPGFEKSAAVSLTREQGRWRFGWMFLAGRATVVDHLPA